LGRNDRLVTLSENDVKARENFTIFFTSREIFHENFHEQVKIFTNFGVARNIASLSCVPG
jgi:hypothetical protein